jgi:hypothetical protein
LVLGFLGIFWAFLGPALLGAGVLVFGSWEEIFFWGGVQKSGCEWRVFTLQCRHPAMSGRLRVFGVG